MMPSSPTQPPRAVTAAARPATRKALYVAVAASLLGVSSGSSTSCSSPWGITATASTSTPRSSRGKVLAFASPQVVAESSNSKAAITAHHQRERDSNVRLFSRGPDTLLSAATLTLTGDSSSRTFFTTPSTPTASSSSSSSSTAGSTATKEDVVTDPFDPNFRPPASVNDDPYWGVPLPVVTTNKKDRTLATTTTTSTDLLPTNFHIYCDLDGVLVDFERGVRSICQAATSELSKTTMWSKISQETAFFAELPWMHDGPQLWDSIQHLKPTILTGVPDLVSS